MKYELGRQSVEELLPQDSFTTIEYLRAEGFSERYIEYFLRPFLGGILLDRDLSTSESVFRFVYGMLAKGDVAIPAWGMGEIAEQLANGLPRGAVRCGRRVVALTRSNGKVTGVRTRDEEIEADAVVSAVSAPQARQLSDVAAPLDEVGCTTLYFATDSPLPWGRKLLLNADSRSFVSHCCSISNVAPNCAPPEKHLLSAVVLGTPDLEDDLIAELALADIDRMSPDSNVKSAKLLAIYRIPHAQTAQPPGFRSKLITDVNPEPGLYLAGDYLRSSSINGAMESGEVTAHAILAGVPRT
ncbi:MAG: FAD-dependent oxidoreductase [Chloroflexia bacterium]